MVVNLLIFLSYATPWTKACTVVAVGKHAALNGGALIAHTTDAGGGAVDLRLVRVPARSHKKHSERPVLHVKLSYPRVVTMDRGPHYEPDLNLNQTVMPPMGSIPQVASTFGYFEQDYGIMNQVQLTIGESTCAAKTVGWPRDLPYGYNLFNVAELTRVALERCDSARCAIQTMGDLAVQHGFYGDHPGDPANPGYGGSAESVAIGDKYGEAWVFHVLTGKGNSSAIWAAQRVPDDQVAAVANGFIIRQMDLNDPDNFMASPNVTTLAEEMGWWEFDRDGPFDFTFAYGYASKPLYIGRRIWRVFDLIAPSLQLDSTLGSHPQFPTYPFSVTRTRSWILHK